MLLYRSLNKDHSVKVFGRFTITPKLSDEHFDKLLEMNHTFIPVQYHYDSTFLVWNQKDIKGHIQELVEVIDLLVKEGHNIAGQIIWVGDELDEIKVITVKDNALYSTPSLDLWAT